MNHYGKSFLRHQKLSICINWKNSVKEMHFEKYNVSLTIILFTNIFLILEHEMKSGSDSYIDEVFLSLILDDTKEAVYIKSQQIFSQ